MSTTATSATLAPPGRRPRPRFVKRQVKTMRVRAGMNLTEAAKLLGLYGAPTLSKIENGKQRPDLDRFFTVYGVEDEARIAETRAIEQLANSNRQRNLFAQYRDIIRAPMADFIELEEIATRIDAYGALVIPGLLQTTEYAHAIIEGGALWRTAREVKTFTELRMKRQDILAANREDKAPVSVRCVLDEASLRREVGGSETLRGQLKHLLVQSRKPNIDLRVLTFKAGAHTALDGPFTTFHFDVGEPVVAVEPLTNALYLEEDAPVAKYAFAFNNVLTRALDPDGSRDLIAKIAKEMP
ncbi:helix-turn-helix transcriptional regulator [Streptomyces stramineus]